MNKNTEVDFFDAPVTNTFEACTIAAPVKDFVLPGLRRDRVGALISQTGLGKSMLALELCCSVVHADAAQTLLGLSLNRYGPALYVSAEDDEEEVRDRIRAIHDHLSTSAQRALYDHLHLSPVADLRNPFDITDTRWLKGILRIAEGCRFIVIDTLSCSYPAENENDNAEMRRPIEAFKDLARDAHASVLFLHHTPKMAQTSGAHPTPRGAGVIGSNSRYVSYLMPMSVAETKNHRDGGRAISQDRAEDYLLWGVTKQNSGARAKPRWLRRENDGVLVRANVTHGNTAKPVHKIASVHVNVAARAEGFDDDL
jgi:RecA-family ATPase